MSLLRDVPMQDAWIVENPWLRNAFSHAPTRSSLEDREDVPRVAPEPAVPTGEVDLDQLARRLHDLDEPSITRICAMVERVLGAGNEVASTVRRATAIGLAIGFTLPRT